MKKVEIISGQENEFKVKLEEFINSHPVKEIISNGMVVGSSGIYLSATVIYTNNV